MSIEINLNPMEKYKEFAGETKEIKTFFQDSFRINYENSSKIFYSEGAGCGDLKVNNYLCRQEG